MTEINKGNTEKKETQKDTAFSLFSEAEHRLEEVTREKHTRHHIYTHKDVNHGKRSFAAGISFYNLVFVFLVGCVIGVTWETLFSLLLTGTVYRASGMLYGPFNQIYGMGGVVLVLLLYRFRNRNNFIIFLASMGIGLLYEYLCSFFQQLIFGSVSWEYSDIPSNIGGRTNLLFGIGWGIMGLLFITHFWPWMSEGIQRIPNKIGRPLTIIIAMLLVVDLTLSGMAVWRYNQRRLGVPATNMVEICLDEKYPNTVILKKYPNMISIDS